MSSRPDPPALARPIAVGGSTWRNRTMMTTHGPRLAQAQYLPYLEVRSRHVAAVGLQASTGVFDLPFGPGRWASATPHPLSPAGRRLLDGTAGRDLEEQIGVVHGNGALAVAQVAHLGLAQQGETTGPVVGPSPGADPHRGRVAHPLRPGEIADVVEAVAAAAGRARRGGADGIEVHAAHGYLVQQFLSAGTNRRSDGYGGSFEHRCRFLFEVLAAVRSEVGRDCFVGVRLPAGEEGGGPGRRASLTIDEVVAVARALAAAEVAYLSISAGTYTGSGHGLGVAYVAPPSQPPAPAAETARRVRSAVGVPVVVSGRVASAAEAEALVGSGGADVVGLTRALVADPDFVGRALGYVGGATRPCVGANECHRERPLACAVNAAAGREADVAVAPRRARVGRRVLVVGGGPAGCGAAIAACDQGGRVTLVDAAGRLGGMLSVLGDLDDPLVARLGDHARWLASEVGRRPVEVVLGRRWGPAEVLAHGADEVVLATGSVTELPSSSGGGVLVVDGVAVLAARRPLVGRVVVIGGRDGHMAGITLARHAVPTAESVDLLLDAPVVGGDLDVATRLRAVADLRAGGVAVHTATRFVGASRAGVEVVDLLLGAPRSLPAADVVVAVGDRRGRRGLAGALERAGVDPVLVGDCLAPRRLVHATYDGAAVAGPI